MLVRKYQDPANDFLKELSMFLMPIQAYLLLNNPHDCFKCVGKDPDRVFSISQYGKREQLSLRMRQKYGKTATVLYTSRDTLEADFWQGQMAT